MVDQKSFSVALIKQIQDINGNPALSPLEKKQAIGNLQGASREDMFDYLNKNFRTGLGLSKNVAKAVSKDRPRGAPSDSAFGTKKKA